MTLPPDSPKRGLVATLGGMVFRDWSRVEVTRSLTDIAGGFQLHYDDYARLQYSIPQMPNRADIMLLRTRMPARIELDGELVLLGWVDEVDWEVDGQHMTAHLSGRDVTGDLVDCSANPEGPAEYKGLTVLAIAQAICKPFGITVRAEVDVGAPLPDFALDVGELAMSAIDKAAKQRALLVVSDGVGGLLLTRGGLRRAPAPLTLPGNAVSFGVRQSDKERYSDYWVKGQVRDARAGRHARHGPTSRPGRARPADGTATALHSRRLVSTGPLDGTAYPMGAGPPVAQATPTRTARQQAERAPLAGTGHAVDPDVTRYRPKVWVARSQSGAASNQVLAEWRMRIARARSVHHRWTVLEWRAGADRRLWRPNETVACTFGARDGPGDGAEPFDMLIEGVAYSQGDREAARTQLAVVGREAYDLEDLPMERRRHGAHSAARGTNVSRVK